MPGLRLTLRQAARLWALDAVHCRAILDALVAEGSLRRSPKGEYCLPRDEEAAVSSRSRDRAADRTARTVARAIEAASGLRALQRA
jgi:hypothetical protein